MGLQYIKTTSSALFTLGIFQIVGNMQQRSLLMEDVFGDFFINPNTRDGWNKIQQVIEPHGLSKVMLTGATPSKPIRQGDGQFGPFMIQRLHANLCMMYKKATELNIIKNPDDELLRLWWNFADFPFQNQEATLRWNAIISAYEVVYELENTTRLLLESIKPFYYTNTLWDKTPMELQFFAGDMMSGNIMKPDSMCIIPWTTIDQFKTGDIDNPGIIDIIFGKSVDDLWYIPVPNISFGGGSKSIPGCDPSTTFALSDDTDCYCKGGSFTPDPPTPDPLPPTPPFTHVTGSVIPDLFQANLWRCQIIPGTDPVITGTVNLTYQRLIVS